MRLVLFALLVMPYDDLNAQYEKLTIEETKKFKKLETKDLWLGRITKFQYTNSGKIYKETTFENEIKFNSEDTYYYNSLDSVIRFTRYSEIPNKKLEEYNLLYDEEHFNYLTIKKDEDEMDSIYYREQRDENGNLILESEIVYRNYEDNVYPHCSIHIYEYDEKGNKIKVIQIYKFELSGISSYKYNEKKQLVESMINSYYIKHKVKATYKYNSSGNVIQKISVYSDGLNMVETRNYKYNDKNLEIEEKLFRDGKLDCTYKTEYDDKGNKIRFYQIQPTESISVCNYFYDEKNRLIYKVDLRSIEDSKKKEGTYEIVAPAEKPK